MTAANATGPIRLLVVNPNSSRDMSDGVEKAIKSMKLPANVQATTYTGPPQSPASINGEADIEASTAACLSDLRAAGLLSRYDGVLVACYSVHPLVDRLAADAEATARGPVVTGIFETSILAALSLLPSNSAGISSSSSTVGARWGIVTTGKFWESHLSAGVDSFLGVGPSASSPFASVPPKFAGVESSGLDAGDFHSVSADEVRTRLREATVRLLRKGEVGCVVMGCAGMAGLEDIIRDAAAEEYGPERGGWVAVVDGVKAGLLQLEVMIRSKRLFVQA